MMPNYFSKNVLFLRKKSRLTQSECASALSLKRNTISNYESGHSEPNIDTIILLAGYFAITVDELLMVNLETGSFDIAGAADGPGSEQHKKAIATLPLIAEPDLAYGRKLQAIPITDIAVAAGNGIYNNSYIEKVEAIYLPADLVKKGSTYLCVQIKGLSMAPTLQDGGFVVVRLLDRAEWAGMPDEFVAVIVDTEGRSYLKRIDTRFSKGFIVLKSDSPDKASFPSLQLPLNDIAAIWKVEWYLSAKMPNVHDQFYTRLQQLEDKVEDLINKK